MSRLCLALLALTAFALLFPVTDCNGLTGAECDRLTAINAGLID
jgi:hypothetical protein